MTISLTEIQRPVLNSIKQYIETLGENPLAPNIHIDRCGINLRKSRSNTDKPQYALVVSDLYFIAKNLIPFLKILNFQTKTKLDYKNWELGVNIMSKGLHKVDAGKDLLIDLMSTMNRGRVSTNSHFKVT
jgi:hypothetical protein